jgi:predicted transcriptional regulator
MMNITLKLDEKLIGRVKHIAVDEDTSVSAWVAGLIESALRDRDAYEAARKGALKDLDQPLHVGGSPIKWEELHQR